MEELLTPRDPDLYLGWGHMAYRHASLIDLYLHTKFHSNRRNVLWTDGMTDGWTSRPALLGHYRDTTATATATTTMTTTKT